MSDQFKGALAAFVRPVIERHRDGRLADHPIYVNNCLDGRIECMQSGRMLALVVPTPHRVALLYRVAPTGDLAYYEAHLYSEVAELARILNVALGEYTTSSNDCLKEE